MCNMYPMRRSDNQSPINHPDVLSQINGTTPALSPYNNPRQFSDAATKSITPNANPSDPTHILAIMVQTRRQCRSHGLIKRDHTELHEIARSIGITPDQTSQIIDLMHESEPTTLLNRSQIRALSTIEVESPQKKTRVQPRVLIGLSIWALTIAVAMQVMH